MKPVQIFAESEYICECDRDLPEAEQTIFILCSLTIEQEAFIDDDMLDIHGKMKSGTLYNNLLNLGLKGVRNFKANKKEIKFKRDEKGVDLPGRLKPWNSKDLQRIPIRQRREIGAKIRTLGEIGDDEAKNS